MFFKSKDSLPRFYKPRDVIADRKYSQTRVTYSLIKKALDDEVSKSENNNLNTRVVNDGYAVPILNSIENTFYYEDTFFTPNTDEVLDVKMRKNAQNCLKILFDFTNLQFKDIFKMLTDTEGVKNKLGIKTADEKSKLWIRDETIDPEKDAISVACTALGLDKIFNKGMFRGLKAKIEKLKNLNNKSYEQKATLFSRLVECNSELQKHIFSELETKPCRYSVDYPTRFAAKQSEKRAKIKAVVENKQTTTESTASM